MIDAGQLEHALLNLALNARDALEEVGGGTVTITCRNVELKTPACALGYEAQSETTMVPGDYVSIEVADGGPGMTPEVQQRAFEPFFTTKEVGRGSGLGLPMVYGFISQSKGYLQVESEPDAGTRIRLFLPRSEQQPEQSGRGEHKSPRGAESVLVVEDNAEVRRVPVHILRTHGYDVEEADSSREALAAMRRRRFDLLFTDIVLPGGMSGTELATEASLRQPDILVIFTTGFADSTTIGSDTSASRLLTEPYRATDLLEKVRGTLDSRRVLIVENEESSGLREGLMRAGFRVRELSVDGFSALPEGTDIIIANFAESPGNQAVLSRLREESTSTPVIGVASNGDVLASLRSAGASETFARPVSNDELVRTINRLTGASGPDYS